MKIQNASISILINTEYTDIEIRDNDAVVTFVRARLTPEQLSSALSRLSNTPCEITINGLDKIGKIHKNETFEFELPDYFVVKPKQEVDEDLNFICIEALKAAGKSDWIPDQYYGSQNSFFNKDGKKYARVTIRKWSERN